MTLNHSQRRCTILCFNGKELRAPADCCVRDYRMYSLYYEYDTDRHKITGQIDF